MPDSGLLLCRFCYHFGTSIVHDRWLQVVSVGILRSAICDRMRYVQSEVIEAIKRSHSWRWLRAGCGFHEVYLLASPSVGDPTAGGRVAWTSSGLPASARGYARPANRQARQAPALAAD
jgi:hypothetical protein